MQQNNCAAAQLGMLKTYTPLSYCKVHNAACVSWWFWKLHNGWQNLASMVWPNGQKSVSMLVLIIAWPGDHLWHCCCWDGMAKRPWMAFLYIGYFYAGNYEGVAPQYYQPFIPLERKLIIVIAILNIAFVKLYIVCTSVLMHCNIMHVHKWSKYDPY